MLDTPNQDRVLPAPSGGRVDIYSPVENNDNAVTNKEKAQPNPETEPNVASVKASNPLVISVPQSASQQQYVAQNSTTDDTSPFAEAADVEVIEKVWVDKAKKVVHETQGDPKKQSLELAKVKADYLKQRFNKSIKLPEDVKQ